MDLHAIILLLTQACWPRFGYKNVSPSGTRFADDIVDATVFLRNERNFQSMFLVLIIRTGLTAKLVAYEVDAAGESLVSSCIGSTFALRLCPLRYVFRKDAFNPCLLDRMSL